MPSHLYSFSFAQRRDWSRLCSPQPEILSTCRTSRTTTTSTGLVVPDAQVDALPWDDATRRWTVETDDGRTLHRRRPGHRDRPAQQPALPDIPGVESFAGHSFHSAAWDHDHDLRRQRVAVVGTGASAVQFVPEIAHEVARLSVFQRTRQLVPAAQATGLPARG